MASIVAPPDSSSSLSSSSSAAAFSNKARHKMLKAHNHALTQLQQKRRKKLKELDKKYKKNPETRPEDGGKQARADISEEFAAKEQELIEAHAQEVAAFENGAVAAAGANLTDGVTALSGQVSSLALNGQSRNTKDSGSSGVSDGKKKMSRYEKRKAKKMAEEAEADRLRAEAEGDVEARREVEKRQLQKELEPLGLTFEDIRADGHCLFTSVAHQLALRNGEMIQRNAHMEYLYT